MPTKTLIWVGMIIGSYGGSYIPTIWGAGVFSMTSIIFSILGGIGGIFLGFYISKMMPL